VAAMASMSGKIV